MFSTLRNPLLLLLFWIQCIWINIDRHFVMPKKRSLGTLLEFGYDPTAWNLLKLSCRASTYLTGYTLTLPPRICTKDFKPIWLQLYRKACSKMRNLQSPSLCPWHHRNWVTSAPKLHPGNGTQKVYPMGHVDVPITNQLVAYHKRGSRPMASMVT